MIRSHVILLVEDNPDDAHLALRAFEQSPVPNEIVLARDGQEALDYLFATGSFAARDPKSVPDVVLLDLKLPKIDGLGVLRRIRTDERTRLLPVVILTSSNEERDVIGSYNLGANSFVQKPVDFSQFMQAAQQLGVYWLALNHPAPARRL
jgi:two-component system response regulator